MIKTIVGQGSDTVEGKNFDFGGVLVVVKAQHTTNNTTIVAGDFDFSKTKVKAVLVRDGVDIPIFSDLITILHSETNFENSGFQLPIVQSVAKGASTKEIALITLSIELHSAINVRGEDKLLLDISLDNGTLGANIDAANTITRVQLLDIEGDEIGIPVIDTRAITGGQVSFNVSGDDVNGVAFINTDKTSALLSDKVIDSVSINTAELRNNINYDQLVGLRTLDFETAATAAARNQNFRVLGKGDHDNCQVDINFNSVNVTSAKNWVVVRRTIMNKKSVQLGVTRAAERTERKLVKAGVGSREKLQALNTRKRNIRSGRSGQVTATQRTY